MILTLMTLWRLNPCSNGRYSRSLRRRPAWSVRHPVLILVLMDISAPLFLEGWGRPFNPCFNGRYTRRTLSRQGDADIYRGLNPCFNGRYSRSQAKTVAWRRCTSSLNPCFNIRYSRRTSLPLFNELWSVLILVLMEDTLGAAPTHQMAMKWLS